MNSNSLAGCIGTLVIFVAAAILMAALNGFVLSTTWNWFVAPTFEVTPLSLWAATGIGLMVSIFKNIDINSIKGKSAEDKLAEIFAGIITPLLVLGLSFIVQMFV